MDKRTDPALTDYERGRANAEYDALNAVEELKNLLAFPHLEKIYGKEWAIGYREYGNAWMVIHRQA